MFSQYEILAQSKTTNWEDHNFLWKIYSLPISSNFKAQEGHFHPIFIGYTKNVFPHGSL